MSFEEKQASGKGKGLKKNTFLGRKAVGKGKEIFAGDPLIHHNKFSTYTRIGDFEDSL